MMKKVFYWVSTVLQVLLFIAAVGIQEFSMKKMGMMRYVVFMNHQWEAQYPIAALRYIAIAFLCILAIAIILYSLRKRRNAAMSNKTLYMLIVEVILTLTFVFFTFSYSTESYRSYYFISVILGILVLIQNVKVVVHLKR